MIISLTTWSMLLLLRLFFSSFSALWVSSWTLTDFAMLLLPVWGYLNLGVMTQFRREFIICPGAYSGL